MPIDLLVTLDENYIKQMKVLMTSIYINNPCEIFNIYLIHSGISEDKLEEIGVDLAKFSYKFIPIRARTELFSSARVTDRYPK